MEISKEDIEVLKNAQDIMVRLDNKYPFKDNHINIMFNTEVKKLRYGLESMVEIISKHLLK